jgi:hypothetical protein
MSDTDDETQTWWQAQLSSGTPIHVYEFDLPITFIKEEGEVLSLDCPCVRIGRLDPAGVVRVRLTKASVDSLKHALAEFEKNPDMRTVTARRQGAN